MTEGAAPGYRPPPPFAPPGQRVAPLNEYQVLGRSTYPGTAQSPQSAQWAAYYAQAARYQPVPWHPGLGAAAAAPPHISRKLTVLVAGAVVAALIAVVALLSHSGPQDHVARSLTIPESAAGYDRISTLSGSQLSSLAGAGSAFGAFPAADLAKARIALYGRGTAGGRPTLVFVGFTADDSPHIGAELRTTEAITVVDNVFAGAGPGAKPVDLDPGPLGGALEVADIDMGGVSATVAVWADQDTLGMLLESSTTRRPGVNEMAGIALAMRSAAER